MASAAPQSAVASLYRPTVTGISIGPTLARHLAASPIQDHPSSKIRERKSCPAQDATPQHQHVGGLPYDASHVPAAGGRVLLQTTSPTQAAPTAAPDAVPTTTVGTTAEQLQSAAVAAAKHIEMRAHLDLRGLTRLAYTDAQGALISASPPDMQLEALFHATEGMTSLRVRSAPPPARQSNMHHGTNCSAAPVQLLSEQNHFAPFLAWSPSDDYTPVLRDHKRGDSSKPEFLPSVSLQGNCSGHDEAGALASPGQRHRSCSPRSHGSACYSYRMPSQ